MGKDNRFHNFQQNVHIYISNQFRNSQFPGNQKGEEGSISQTNTQVFFLTAFGQENVLGIVYSQRGHFIHTKLQKLGAIRRCHMSFDSKNSAVGLGEVQWQERFVTDSSGSLSPKVFK